MEDYSALSNASRQSGPDYTPTAFWQVATAKLLDDLARDGIENFRKTGSPLDFFVPTYGHPGNSLMPKQVSALRAVAEGFGPKQAAMVEAWVTGHTHALSDYRAFSAAARAGGAKQLLKFSESSVGNPVEHFKFDGRMYSRSALNYLTGLAFLAEHEELGAIKTVLEIGGGFGTLGEIISQCWPQTGCRYIDVDLYPTCQFADYYLTHACPDQSVKHSNTAVEPETISIQTLPALSILPNWQIETLRGTIDLFVNFISFQEMEPDVVRNYLNHVDRLGAKLVLLRNMREGKQKRKHADDVGVETPILIEDYDKMLPNYTVVDRETTVFGYRTSDGFHSDLVLLRRSGI